MKYREHFQEIYWRLFYTFVGFFFGSTAAYSEKESLLYALIQPLREALTRDGKEAEISFVFLKITEAFTSEIYLALLMSLFLTTPLLWLQIWFFLAPGFYRNEQRFLGSLLLISWLLISMSFYLSKNFLLPQAWAFFLSFSDLGARTDLSYLPSLVPYINLSMEIFFGIILSSQLPVIFFLVIHWGWFSTKRLVASRPWVLLIFLLWAGLISPPDLYSQIFIFLPLYACYESAIFFLACHSHWREDMNKREDSQENLA